MTYREFDWLSTEELAKTVADSLRKAGIRFQQYVLKIPKQRLRYGIRVHKDDFVLACSIRDRENREYVENWARNQSYTRTSFQPGPMLISRTPNEAGFFASFKFNGESFDEERFRLITGGWDHEHCRLCAATVNPGDEWWSANRTNSGDDEMGLCLECHAQFFPE